MKILKTSIFLFLLILLAVSSEAQRNFRQEITLEPGEYLFNFTDLYFFDDGIDCYLLQKCRDVDTVFSNQAQKIVVSTDSAIKYQAYLFTDNYDYVYTKINQHEGWMRVNFPISDKERIFLTKYLKSDHFEPFSSFVEIIPFKNDRQIFISTTDDWYIANLDNFKINNIGTKGGRLVACRMVFPKNCVKCYIDIGWGQNVWYDSKGRKIKTKK